MCCCAVSDREGLKTGWKGHQGQTRKKRKDYGTCGDEVGRQYPREASVEDGGKAQAVYLVPVRVVSVKFLVETSCLVGRASQRNRDGLGVWARRVAKKS